MSSIEYETPEDFFNTLNKEFHFDVDVCASKENAKCPFYYTYYENGLYQDWEAKCWMNPPYNKDIGRWIAKAYESAQVGATVVCLIEVRSTDTKWFHKYGMKASEIRFVKDRLHFRLNGKSGRAKFSSMLIVFRPYCEGPPIVSSIDTKGKHI